jgi:hypothetical protein
MNSSQNSVFSFEQSIARLRSRLTWLLEGIREKCPETKDQGPGAVYSLWRSEALSILSFARNSLPLVPTDERSKTLLQLGEDYASFLEATLAAGWLGKSARLTLIAEDRSTPPAHPLLFVFFFFFSSSLSLSLYFLFNIPSHDT